MKKLIVNTIAWILIITDGGTLLICFYLMMTDQKDSAGLPATICGISAFLSLVFILVDVCIIEEGGTKPL
jgi:hypothetical protein